MNPGKSLVNSIVYSTVDPILISVRKSAKYNIRDSIRHQLSDCPTLDITFRNVTICFDLFR